MGTIRAGERSIVERMDRMTRRLTLLLGIPVIAAMIMMILMAAQYARENQRMNTIASLKPIVESEIPETVWNMVSGRTTAEESGVMDRIQTVNRTMERVSEESGGNQQLELVVARRTMDTLSQYVDQIRINIVRETPVVENEKILQEVRDVAALVASMLNDYITEAIGAGALTVQLITRAAYAGAAVELLLLAAALVMTARFRKKTAQFIREPIAQLESVTAKLAEGDMSARLPLTQVSELWNLTGQVNVMADNLEEMMRQRLKDERALKKAELRTLQAQINPHFLYNTLDAIVWKAEAGDQEEVIQLTRSLSDFFRISLSSGADWISISQEKKHIAGYLSIQKTRYHDILNYEIDIPDEIGGYYMLKLLLQPLVENALYHGIKNTRGGGLIRVTGAKEGEELVFEVSDTGKGMTPETLEKVRESMRESTPPALSSGGGGFGLVNVNLRLRLYYNQPGGLSIESGPGGTRASFRVPCRRAEEIEEEESSRSKSF
ncbi:MAG: histidine kinase [Clostridia bacterium]|nr:histidine kinase [Clostridia bacterium]